MREDLTDNVEVLFRQVHPSFIEQNGEPSSAPFRPSDKDDNELSVDRSSMTTPSASFALYKSNGFASDAVYGLSVEEFQAVQIPCKSDPIAQSSTQSANPAHAIADFSAHGTNKQKTIAKRLKIAAINRGKLHP